MTKHYNRVLTVCLLVLFIFSILSAFAGETNEPKTVKGRTSLRHRRVAPVVSDATVLARVADQKVLGGEFRKRWLYALQPNSYIPVSLVEPVDPNDILMEMMGEIVLALEGRKQGVHKTEVRTRDQIKKYKHDQLYRTAVQTFILPSIKVSKDEVKAAMEANPKLTEPQAQNQIGRAKVGQAVKAYTKQLQQKLNYSKNAENIKKAAELHKRLLLHPKTPRSQTWILNKQMREELSKEEKAIVLAKYDGGQFTVYDFFMGIDRIAPNGRPKDLNTPEGVTKFIDNYIPRQLFAQAAINAKLDQSADYKVTLQKYEDRLIQNHVMSSIRKSVPDPNDSDMEVYLKRIKDHFGKRDLVKAHTLWCRNKAEAKEAKKVWEAGEDVNDLITKYAFDKESSTASSRYFQQEGLFWESLWKADPNSVVGPILGFYSDRNRREMSLKWRVVKILEKVSEEPEKLDDNARSSLMYVLKEEWIKEAIRKKTEALLKEYSHEIHREHIDHFSPFRVP